MRLTSIKQLPRRVRKFVRTSQLGTPHILYEPANAGQLHLFFAPLAFLVGGFIIGAYYYYYVPIFSWWPVEQTFLVRLIGFVWLLIGFWILLPPLIRPHLRVFLCPKGLIYLRRKIEIIRWDQIYQLAKLLTLDKYANIDIAYQITRNDGAVFVLKNDLPYLDRLGGFMEREVTRQLLPHVLTTYTEQSMIKFGDILLTAQGIGLESEMRLLPWSELASLTVSNTTLSICRIGDEWDWATLSISGLPNPGVLQGVVEHILHTTALSPYMQAYNAGFSFLFGALNISNSGIILHNNDLLLPWSEIASLGVGENEVILRRRSQPDEWQTIPLAKISDVPTLQKLLDYIMSSSI